MNYKKLIFTFCLLSKETFFCNLEEIKRNVKNLKKPINKCLSYIPFYGSSIRKNKIKEANQILDCLNDKTAKIEEKVQKENFKLNEVKNEISINFLKIHKFIMYFLINNKLSKSLNNDNHKYSDFFKNKNNNIIYSLFLKDYKNFSLNETSCDFINQSIFKEFHNFLIKNPNLSINKVYNFLKYMKISNINFRSSILSKYKFILKEVMKFTNKLQKQTIDFEKRQLTRVINIKNILKEFKKFEDKDLNSKSIELKIKLKKIETEIYPNIFGIDIKKYLNQKFISPELKISDENKYTIRLYTYTGKNKKLIFYRDEPSTTIFFDKIVQ